MPLHRYTRRRCYCAMLLRALRVSYADSSYAACRCRHAAAAMPFSSPPLPPYILLPLQRRLPWRAFFRYAMMPLRRYADMLPAPLDMLAIACYATLSPTPYDVIAPMLCLLRYVHGAIGVAVC